MAKRNRADAKLRFGVKLLFQFRVAVDGKSAKRRLCEERIINTVATSPRQALRKAREYARGAEHAYENSDGNRVNFEFVGILDLVGLGVECDEMEVWYEVNQKLQPMERRKKLIPDDAALLDRVSKR